MIKTYAIVSKVRKQVLKLTEKTSSVNPEFNLIIDITDHPQKGDIRLDWFYDEDTNSFNGQGEIYYPDPEPELAPEPTYEDRMEAKTDYIVMMQGGA